MQKMERRNVLTNRLSIAILKKMERLPAKWNENGTLTAQKRNGTVNRSKILTTNILIYKNGTKSGTKWNDWNVPPSIIPENHPIIFAMKRITLMAIATTLFFSCHKEAENHSAKSKVTTQPSTDANDFSFHRPRFYDSMGMLHNQILAAFQKVYNRENQQTPENFQHFLSDYMSDKQSKMSEQPNHLPSEEVLNIIKRYLKKDFGTIENPEVEHYLRTIFDRITVTNSFDTALYSQRIQELENQIRIDKSLRPPDKNMLLATTSVARHSGCWWLDFYESQNENFQNSRLGILKKLLKAIGITLADATGIAYDYFSNRPVNEWTENAAWFSEVGYWSIDHLQNGDTYK